MVDMLDIPLEIVESTEFRLEVERLSEKYPRINEVLDGQYPLCRGPKKLGTLISNEEHIYLWLTSEIGTTPSFRLLYRVLDDKEQIEYIAISPVTEKMDDD